MKWILGHGYAVVIGPYGKQFFFKEFLSLRYNKKYVKNILGHALKFVKKYIVLPCNCLVK